MTNDFFNNPYFRPHVSVDIIRVFFNFRFSLRKSQSQQKPAKKINYFTIQLYNYFFAQKTSLILRTSTHSTLKKICFRNTAKNLSHFTNVPANIWLVSKKKKHLHGTISRRARNAFSKHFESKCLYIFVYLRMKIFVPETQ